MHVHKGTSSAQPAQCGVAADPPNCSTSSALVEPPPPSSKSTILPPRLWAKPRAESSISGTTVGDLVLQADTYGMLLLFIEEHRCLELQRELGGLEGSGVQLTQVISG